MSEKHGIIEISLNADFWPSKRTNSIGGVKGKISEIAAKLNVPIFRLGNDEDDTALFFYLPNVGYVSFSRDPYMMLSGVDIPIEGLNILIDDLQNPWDAKDAIEAAFGQTLEFSWPPGAVKRPAQ